MFDEAEYFQVLLDGQQWRFVKNGVTSYEDNMDIRACKSDDCADAVIRMVKFSTMFSTFIISFINNYNNFCRAKELSFLLGQRCYSATQVRYWTNGAFSGTNLKITRVDHREECIALCINTENCVAFEFKHSTSSGLRVRIWKEIFYGFESILKLFVHSEAKTTAG